MTATEQVRDTLIRDCDDATIAEVCAIIDAEIARLTAEIDAQAGDAKAWRTLRRYERLLIAGFCSYADLNAAKAEAQQAAQEATS